MLALATFAFLAGVFLGSRYAVLVLVPANLIAAACIVVEAVVFGDGLFDAKTAFAVAITGLQAGYIGGLALAHLSPLKRRSESGAPTNDGFQSMI